MNILIAVKKTKTIEALRKKYSYVDKETIEMIVDTAYEMYDDRNEILAYISGAVAFTALRIMKGK